MNIQPGDEFAVQTGGLLGKLIRLRNRISASDGEATYNHCGIITNPEGDTFEARRKITQYNLFDMYAGQKIIIARADAQQFFKDAAIRRLVMHYEGLTYPWWRIIVHAISPTIAKYLHASGIPVCSELVAEYRHLIGTRHENYYGTTPDCLVDEWGHWRKYTIVFEGILPDRESFRQSEGESNE